LTACIALASVGGVEASFFTAQRCSPWLSRHSQGDSKVTGGEVAAAVLQRNAAMMSVVARVIAARSYFVVAVWRAKEAEFHRVNYWNIIADTLDSLNKARLWNSRDLSAHEKDAH
jgi:hypothetical protein